LVDKNVWQVLVANADGSDEKLLYQGAEGATFSGLSWGAPDDRLGVALEYCGEEEYGTAGAEIGRQNRESSPTAADGDRSGLDSGRERLISGGFGKDE